MSLSNYDVIESIKARYCQLFEAFEEGDIDEQTLFDTWEGIDGEIEHKADAIAYLISKRNDDIEARNKEIKRLQDKNTVDEHAIERFKKMLWGMMEVCEKTKFKTPYHSFNIAGNGGVKPILFANGEADLDAIDERFVTYERKLNTKAVREALDNDEKLDFAWFGERGKHLDIR